MFISCNRSSTLSQTLPKAVHPLYWIHDRVIDPYYKNSECNLQCKTKKRKILVTIP